MPIDLAERAKVEGFIKNALAGDAVAQYNVGVSCEYGRGGEPNIKDAIEWYRKSARQGYAAAQANMGYFYASGKGVRKNHKQAESWFRKAAEQGHARGQFNLGTYYQNGTAEGVRNMEEALRLYHRSSDQGFVPAMMQLAAI